MPLFYSEKGAEVSKVIFESLRNSLVCGAVAVAGIAIEKYPKLSFLGAEYAVITSMIVVLLAAFLFVWNIPITYYRLNRNPKIRSKNFWFIDLPLFAVYIAISVSLFGAAVKLQGNQLKSSVNVQENSKCNY